MASLSFRATTAIHQFRDATERQSAMAGVTGPSFVCRRCGEVRATKGRKAIVPGYSKAGYACAGCA